MSDAWRRFGQLPATPVVACFFALAILAGLTLGDASPWVGVALFAAFVAYCIARPARGMDLFLAAILIPAVLLSARSIDREATA